MNKKSAGSRPARVWPAILALVILSVTGIFFALDKLKFSTTRGEDTPPVIDLTWTPLGPTDLTDFRGYLKMRDDYALDFTAYRFSIAEIGIDLDMPIDGLIGKEYETPISLALLANRADIWNHSRLTIKISIADDKGQTASIERVVRIRPSAGAAILKVE